MNVEEDTLRKQWTSRSVFIDGQLRPPAQEAYGIRDDFQQHLTRIGCDSCNRITFEILLAQLGVPHPRSSIYAKEWFSWRICKITNKHIGW
ncbi:hypothetical protein KIN20_003135 [Parelaphostrongylus tenuis]|uniref:Uncharacterized protein n=1 Tax=Parelaphostrongylus tenuis TaxID=148309 RepID=A0AAD5LZN6_PARTN|nr:hypothetical protein KIN20_003135 [Parelaphostrongylus tenuis]